MDLLLLIFLDAAAVFGCIKMVTSTFSKIFNVSVRGGNMQFIGAGSKEKEKAKTLDKPVASDPAATGGVANGDIAPGGSGVPTFSGARIPDMSGIDSGANLPGMPAMSGGGAPSANLAIGLVNGVLIGPQSGRIKNKFTAVGRQIVGPVRQTGMNFTTVRKGLKTISQIGNNTAQSNRGKVTINQAGNANTSITGSKKLSLNAANSNNTIRDTKKKITIKAPKGAFYGNNELKKVKAENATINTGEIKKLRKASGINIGNFVAAEGTKVKVHQLENLNMAGKQKGSKSVKTYKAVKGSHTRELLSRGIQSPSTAVQSLTQNATNTNVDRGQRPIGLRESNIPSSVVSNRFIEVKNRREFNNVMGGVKEQLASSNIQVRDGKMINTLAKKAQDIQREENRRRREEIRANLSSSQNANSPYMEAVNNVLKSTPGSGERLSSYRDNNFKDIYSFTEEQMEKFREQAKINVAADEANQNISAEEREEKEEQDVKRLQEEQILQNQQEADEYIKKQILKDPDGNVAREILGDEGQGELQMEFLNIQAKEDQEIEAEILKQKMEEIKKKHPNAKSYELEDLVEQEELKKCIKKAIKSLGLEKQSKHNPENAPFANNAQAINDNLTGGNAIGDLASSGTNTQSDIEPITNSSIPSITEYTKNKEQAEEALKELNEGKKQA